jgi:hypothetical protein
MRDLHEGILLEFAQHAPASRTGTFQTLPFGFSTVPQGGRVPGTCSRCGGAPEEGRTRCKTCAVKHSTGNREYGATYYAKNKEAVKARVRESRKKAA